MQTVQNGLVRNFSRQANVFWRNLACRWTHEYATPVRRSTQDMRDMVFAKTIEVLAQRLPDIRKYERTSGEDGTKKDLKTAIATHIIKSPPNGRPLFDLASIDGRRQSPQAVRNHFRQTGGTGCEKDPFGWAPVDLEVSHGPNRSSAHEMPANTKIAIFWRIVIAYNRIDARFYDY